MLMSLQTNQLIKIVDPREYRAPSQEFVFIENEWLLYDYEAERTRIIEHSYLRLQTCSFVWF